jgi:transcription elongation factor GreA
LTLNDLVHLARSLQLDTLEQAWSAAVKAPRAEDAARYRAAVETLCAKDMAGKALALCLSMVESLATNDMLDEAIDLGQAVMRAGAHNDAIVGQLGILLRKRYGDQDWFALLSERAGLGAESPDSQNILEFDRLRRFTPRNAIYHPGGWGEGVVEQFSPAQGEVTVVFASGRRSDFPLQTVLDRFKPLEPDDLRAMRLLRPEVLRSLAEKEPSQLIRKAARMYRGTINSQQVKAELCGPVISEREWTSFWKRARSAATNDPWLKVEGSAARPVFVLRDKPVGLGDEASAALRHATNLGERIMVLRDYLTRSQDKDVQSQVLDLGEQVVRQALEKKSDSHAHILDGILLLEEHGRTPPASYVDELRALIITADGRIKPQAVDQLAVQESKDRAVRHLPEALGPGWDKIVIDALLDFPDSILEQTVTLLSEQGHGPRLLDLWERVAPYPRRFPMMTYLLCKLYAEGVFDAAASKPEPVTVGRVALHLARVLTAEKRGNTASSRLLGRVTSLLAGKRGFLASAMEHISREDLSTYLGITERGGEEFPQEIIDAVLRVVARRHPDLTAKPDKPFWERDEVIFTTREGLKRIKDDYHVLVDEKIPANSTAIGHAAALGDLSENSEWESAMEEQRNLTSRATTMDKEIKSAKLIEEQEIPEGIVAPGTAVACVEEGTEVRHTLTILGPWDSDQEGFINYRAPLAQKLLGKRVGDHIEIPTLRGTVMVVIENITRAV